MKAFTVATNPVTDCTPYATPFLLGGPLFKMMAPVIYNEFTQKTNWPFGGAIAFILMAVTLSLTIAANLLLQRRAAR